MLQIATNVPVVKSFQFYRNTKFGEGAEFEKTGVLWPRLEQVIDDEYAQGPLTVFPETHD